MVDERKDRLIQTRVPERLETTLKEEARRQRTSVSQMIRNVLEDTFHLVDDVVANVDQIVSDSVEFAQQVGRETGLGRGRSRDCGEPLPDAEGRLSQVDAWNEVVLNKSVACTKCGRKLERGGKVFAGLGSSGDAPRSYVCAEEIASLRVQGDREKVSED